MDFLSKLRTYIQGDQKQWKKQVSEEKKQKYLFGNQSSNNVFQSQRGGTVKRKIGKNLHISKFFIDNINGSDILKTYANLMAFIGGFLILLCVYITIFSPYFKISPNQVLVEAITPGVDVSIAYRALEGIYGESIFLLDEASIAKKLKLQLGNLGGVRIDRLYPNGVKVLISGLPIVFNTKITGIEGKKWGLSENGILIPERDMGESAPKYSLQITSSELLGDAFINYKQGIEENNAYAIKNILELFEKEWPMLKIESSTYFKDENELHVKVGTKTIIIFALQDESEKKVGNLSKNIFDQLFSLKTYIANNSDKIKNGSITYIDARTPGKLFVCGDAVQCKQNLILIYGETYK